MVGGVVEEGANGRSSAQGKPRVVGGVVEEGANGRRGAPGTEEMSAQLAWIRAVMERFEGPLVRYATSLAGSEERARDAVQDTFFRLCEAERAAVEQHLAAWLYRVCRNRAIDLRRKERPLRPLAEGELDQHASVEPTPAAVLERREAAAHLLACVAQLPESQQEVVRLKFQEGLSYREISEVTGHSVGNVGFLIHRAVKALRARLACADAERALPARSVP